MKYKTAIPQIKSIDWEKITPVKPRPNEVYYEFKFRNIVGIDRWKSEHHNLSFDVFVGKDDSGNPIPWIHDPEHNTEKSAIKRANEILKQQFLTEQS